MKILVDMNLAPAWVDTLNAAGHAARHWTEVGPPSANDATLMAWARANGHVVLTHDLDFTALLAASSADGPSIIQVRAQDSLPSALGSVVLRILADFETELTRGAIVTIDPARARVRLLPLPRG